MNVQDKLLVWRFNRGDYEAVRVIYEKYKHELLALAMALLKNTAEAEDVVHHVFEKFLKLKRFHLTGSLKGYLATCVANAARNILRGKGRHPTDPLDDDSAIKSSEAGPDCAAMDGEESRLLKRAIAELPYEQREVVMLHVRGGLKFSEIAQTQNVSVNTVLGRYRYGLEKLRARLNGEMSKCDRIEISNNCSRS